MAQLTKQQVQERIDAAQSRLIEALEAYSLEMSELGSSVSGVHLAHCLRQRAMIAGGVQDGMLVAARRTDDLRSAEDVVRVYLHSEGSGANFAAAPYTIAAGAGMALVVPLD